MAASASSSLPFSDLCTATMEERGDGRGRGKERGVGQRWSGATARRRTPAMGGGVERPSERRRRRAAAGSVRSFLSPPKSKKKIQNEEDDGDGLEVTSHLLKNKSSPSTCQDPSRTSPTMTSLDDVTFHYLQSSHDNLQWVQYHFRRGPNPCTSNFFNFPFNSHLT